MAKKTCSDQEFIALFEAHGSKQTAKILNISERSTRRRRQRLEKRHTRIITPPSLTKCGAYESRLPIKILDGYVIIGSDAHYWPDEITCAHKALCEVSKKLQPKVIILNGDVFDGAKISRHPPLGFSYKPSVKDELYAVEQRLDEIEKACKSAQKYWTVGNHDLRFENRLANNAPEFGGIQGFSLADHIPGWKFAMSLWINDLVVVKHRFKGGVHATHNNTLAAGKSIVTGHLHSLKVTPYSDYNGNRFGIDTGTLARPYGDQFDYCEDNPVNWRSGFIVLKFHKGKLLWPEIVHVISDNEYEFRGEVFLVK